jgi:hypothetical protein
VQHWQPASSGILSNADRMTHARSVLLSTWVREHGKTTARRSVVASLRTQSAIPQAPWSALQAHARRDVQRCSHTPSVYRVAWSSKRKWVFAKITASDTLHHRPLVRGINTSNIISNLILMICISVKLLQAIFLLLNNCCVVFTQNINIPEQ